MKSPRASLLRAGEALLTILTMQALGAGLVPASATNVCGSVCDEIWTAPGNPFVVTCDVTVAAGCTLTIEAGVTVRFSPASALVVQGTLDVNGTSGSPVDFLSDAGSPRAGDWKHLRFEGSASGTLDGASILHAAEGVFVTGDATVSLRNVDIAGNTHGLHVLGTGGSSLQVLDQCNIYDNDYGLWVDLQVLGAYVDVTDSAFFNNNEKNVLTTGAGAAVIEHEIVHARGNWWGTSDPLVIGVGIQRGLDLFDINPPKVDWCAYLESSSGPPHPANCPDLTVRDGETQTLADTGTHYLLTDTLDVLDGGTLVLQAGTEVRSVEGRSHGFVVEGDLQVNGTAGSPVTLTTDDPVPDPGDMGSIQVRFGTATISYLNVHYAGSGIDVYSGRVTADHVTATSNVTGIVASYGQPELTLTDSTITGNGIGVLIEADDATLVSIHDSSIHSNSSYQVEVREGPSQAAIYSASLRSNWWGTTDSAQIAAGIHDNRDDPLLHQVNFCEYLDGPGGLPRPMHCPLHGSTAPDYVWDDTTKPYVLLHDVTISPGRTLQITEGVEVLAVAGDPPVSLIIQSTLDVDGTAMSPVTFGSDAASPAAGDWSGIALRNGSINTIDHAEIRHAARAIHVFEGSSAWLDGVLAEDNTDGLFLYGNLALTAANSAFVGNDRYGVYARGVSTAPDAVVDISASEIHGNAGWYDFYLDGGFSTPLDTIFMARNNWWGYTTPSAIAARIFDRYDSPTNAMVDWCRYLDAAGGAPRAVNCVNPRVCDRTETLDRTDAPYLVTQNIEVCPTGTLRIEPGVAVRFAKMSPAVKVYVQGTLDVNGTPGFPVLMTSDETVQQALDWQGLDVVTGSTSDLVYATIEYANEGIKASGDAWVRTNGVTSRRNRYGLYVDGSGPPTIDVTGSHFTENTYYGVLLYGDPNPDVTIVDSSLFGNLSSYDLYTAGWASAARTVLRMWDNWWGTSDPEQIGARIHGQRRNTAAPVVDYCHYLNDAPPAGVRARDVHCPELVACDAPATWDLTDKPYQIVTDVRVCNGETLTVGPGVEARVVNTVPQPDFRVLGTLDVNGTQQDPVLFTSDATVPQALDWPGLLLTTGSTSELDHLTVEYANRGIEATADAQVTMDGVTSRYNRYGLYVDGGGPPAVTVMGSKFTENTYYGVLLYGDPNPDVTISRTSLLGNQGGYDLYTAGYAAPAGSIVWATDNWWGTTNDALIENRIHDHNDNLASPWVHYRAFGAACEWSLGLDGDRDGRPDFDDNCPERSNATQADADGDLMGDACDPNPSTPPAGACDGFQDLLEGYLDADGDGWGDPCDHHPLRADSYPGAPELCDARDNDGDGALLADERVDEDLDFGILCGDCDDLEPLSHVCACEQCSNAIDDDCDTLADAADTDCALFDTCILLTAGTEPWLEMDKGACGGATLDGSYDVIRGRLGDVHLAGGSVDLGTVSCVAADHPWDRASDSSLNPNPKCEGVPARFYLAKNRVDPDYGGASSGERRDVVDPDPACP